MASRSTLAQLLRTKMTTEHAPLRPVLDDGVYVGETIQTVGGFKAYDLDDALIGTFPTHDAAVAALCKASSERR